MTNVVSGVASAIAAAFIEKRVRAGGIVTIPSLGIVLSARHLKEPVMPDQYLESLAREYLELIRLAHSPDYDADVRRELSSQRSLVHDELIRVLGDAYARPFDMKAHCRQLLDAPDAAR